MRQRRAHRRRGCAGSSVPIWNLPASESALQSSRRSRRSPGIQPVHRERRSCRRRCRRSVCQCSARERGQYAPGSGLRPGSVRGTADRTRCCSHPLSRGFHQGIFGRQRPWPENARDAQRQHARGFHAARGERLPPAPAAGYLPAHRRYPPPALPAAAPAGRIRSAVVQPASRYRNLPALR